ncbi:hypothetical protein D7Y16_09440 [Stenotrophomonas maltophilia]|nr:hypothetical protein [Stenotrophomonas maltophilia]MBA0246150.1 hypothetical protein [Stenotrophomonas maltophilia]MBA0307056.1 hypothetical protein [Stenotrophomonas maltophilia]MBA0439259.1 hypothetical protein [Stenotrophomonas maltophilia]MBA0514926.1 hypothetical protein [Stenotrophomonas maltophilia]
MDAATELTGTYLQRPLRNPPRPAKHGIAFGYAPPRGAQPLAETLTPPAAPPPPPTAPPPAAP